MTQDQAPEQTNPPTPDATQEAAPAQPAMPFDQSLAMTGRDYAIRVLSEHPELRSVVIVFDYNGRLNDAQVNKAVFHSSSGAQATPEAIFGTMNNTFQMIEYLMKSAAGVAGNIQRAVGDGSVKLADMHEQVTQKETNVQQLAAEEQRLNARVELLRELGKLPADPAPAEAPPAGTKTDDAGSAG